MTRARGLAILVLAAAAGNAWGQILTGGSFQMTNHSVGPAASGAVAVNGSSFTFSGFQAGVVAPSALTNPLGFSLVGGPQGVSLYSHLVANSIQAFGNTGQVSVRAQAVPQDYDFIFNTKPLTNPVRIDPAVINAADSRLSQTYGAQSQVIPQSMVELDLKLESGEFYDSALANPAILSIDFQTDARGAVLGTNPPIRARTLAMYTLDEAHGLWVKLPDSSVDVVSGQVTATIPHFSVYTLAGAADQDVGSVYAFPVPWAPSSGDPSNGTFAGGITFTNLPTQGTIKIYTVSGQLVRTLTIPSGIALQTTWDVKTDGGHDVASGVYIWRVESGRNSKAGKLIVIR